MSCSIANECSVRMAEKWPGAVGAAPAVADPYMGGIDVAKRTCIVEDCGNPPRSPRADWCPKHYHRWYRRRPITQDPPRTIDQRLKARSRRGGPSGDCLEWTGALSTTGYGRINLGDGRIEYVHRFVYTREHGPIPEGMYICHHCDNPPCFEQSHLFLGTPSDNIRDAIAKGRHRPPPPGSRWQKSAVEDFPAEALRRGFVIRGDAA